MDHGDARPATAKAYPAELLALIERADAGDASALPELRRAFEAHPELPGRLYDLAAHARNSLLSLATASLAVREAIGLQADALRDRLAAASASELERLLADRVTLCWLAAHLAEVDQAERARQQGVASAEARAAVQRLDRAHARLLSACRSLATVQKLLRPGVSPYDLATRTVAEAPSPAFPRPRQAGAGAAN